MHYLSVVIIFFSAGLYKSAFSTYFFGKLGFHLSVFWFFMFLYLWFLAFLSLFYVLNLMSFLIPGVPKKRDDSKFMSPLVHSGL